MTFKSADPDLIDHAVRPRPGATIAIIVVCTGSHFDPETHICLLGAARDPLRRVGDREILMRVLAADLMDISNLPGIRWIDPAPPPDVAAPQVLPPQDQPAAGSRKSPAILTLSGRMFSVRYPARPGVRKLCRGDAHPGDVQSWIRR